MTSAVAMQQTGCQGTAFHLMASLVINSLMYGRERATLNITQELGQYLHGSAPWALS